MSHGEGLQCIATWRPGPAIHAAVAHSLLHSQCDRQGEPRRACLAGMPAAVTKAALSFLAAQRKCRALLQAKVFAQMPSSLCNDWDCSWPLLPSAADLSGLEHQQ